MPQSKKDSFLLKNNRFLLLTILVIVLGYFTVSDYIKRTYRGKSLVSENESSEQVLQNGTNQAEIVINGKKITAEVADDDIKRVNGLSYRDELDKNSGMLFVFEEPERPYFWMKDMNFSLDIIWIKDNKIIGIDKNIATPNPNTPLQQLTLYSPTDVVNYVLEVNGGFCDEKGIKVGDAIQIKI